MLTNIDENGKAIEMPVKKSKDGEEKEEKAIKLTPTKITQESLNLDLFDFGIDMIDTSQYKNLEDYFENHLKPLIAEFDYKEKDLKVYTDKMCYWYDADKDSLVEAINNSQLTINNYLGCGKIVIKATLKKDSKTKQAKSISITAELTKDLQKDYEIIPYSPNEATNQKNIADFMAKYVFKPFEYLDNVIGVEINFNKVFYTPEKLREVSNVAADLGELENELLKLQNELGL